MFTTELYLPRQNLLSNKMSTNLCVYSYTMQVVHLKLTELLARHGLITSNCNTNAPKNIEVIAVASPLLQMRGAPPLLLSIDGKAESQTLFCTVTVSPSSTIAATAAPDAIFETKQLFSLLIFKQCKIHYYCIQI